MIIIEKYFHILWDAEYRKLESARNLELEGAIISGPASFGIYFCLGLSWRKSIVRMRYTFNFRIESSTSLFLVWISSSLKFFRRSLIRSSFLRDKSTRPCTLRVVPSFGDDSLDLAAGVRVGIALIGCFFSRVIGDAGDDAITNFISFLGLFGMHCSC